MSRLQKNLGDLGEGFARGYLRRRGYEILFAPYRCRFGEIDIIAKDDDIIVFVEVKTRRGSRYGSPLESVTVAKQKQIVRVARHFIASMKTAHTGCFRFDVLGITEAPGSGTPHVKHVLDAFRDDSGV